MADFAFLQIPYCGYFSKRIWLFRNLLQLHECIFSERNTWFSFESTSSLFSGR